MGRPAAAQNAAMSHDSIRIPVGGGIGSAEHHSDSPEAYFAHTAGLRVVSPSDPQDAFTLIQQAIASDDPVLFFEPKRRYHAKGEVDEDAPLARPRPDRVDWYYRLLIVAQQTGVRS